MGCRRRQRSHSLALGQYGGADKPGQAVNFGQQASNAPTGASSEPHLLFVEVQPQIQYPTTCLLRFNQERLSARDPGESPEAALVQRYAGASSLGSHSAAAAQGNY